MIENVAVITGQNNNATGAFGLAEERLQDRDVADSPTERALLWAAEGIVNSPYNKLDLE